LLIVSDTGSQFSSRNRLQNLSKFIVIVLFNIYAIDSAWRRQHVSLKHTKIAKLKACRKGNVIETTLLFSASFFLDIPSSRQNHFND